MSDNELRSMRRGGHVLIIASFVLGVLMLFGFPGDVAAPLIVGIGAGLILAPASPPDKGQTE